MQGTLLLCQIKAEMCMFDRFFLNNDKVPPTDRKVRKDMLLILRVTIKLIDWGINVVNGTYDNRNNVSICLYLFNRPGPETRPGGGVIYWHQVHQRRVSEWSGTSSQWLSRWSHSPTSLATLPLLPTWTLREVKALSSAVSLKHTDISWAPHVHMLQLWNLSAPDTAR